MVKWSVINEINVEIDEWCYKWNNRNKVKDIMI
jgi:hypothetical protein